MNSMSGEKLKGIPYTGTLPAVLTGTKAGYLHKYKVYGNLTQNGTPTPSDPIYPSECGERTENLYNKADSSMNFMGYVNTSGTVIVSSLGSFSIIVPVEPNTTYTVVKPATSRFRVGLFTSYPYERDDATAIYGDRDSPGMDHGTSLTFTTSNDTSYILAFIRNYDDPGTTNEQMKNLTMVFKGSTAPTSYIPYGYKLPLLSGSTPVDIYLGESQTTRRIKKLVLTGEDDLTWYKSATRNYSWYLHPNTIGTIMNTPFYCSHGETVTNVSDYEYGKVYCDNTVNLGIFDSSIDTTTKLNNYFAQQYANGTPVTIWYVLATEETGTLNEPLRKIGDYADTIESTQTSAQIPTSANSTTISWGGQGLVPSEFDSIQEWVDIPTYKRVNGEWVADNSN